MVSEFQKWIQCQNINEDDARKTWLAAMRCAKKFWSKWPFQLGGLNLIRNEIKTIKEE